MKLAPAQQRFARYAWGTLWATVLVILWGAVVRATGSGAGCGSHWPLCNGEVVPLSPGWGTLIEFGHRATSGVDLLLVVGLVWGARRTYAAGAPVRTAAWASLVVILLEALLGAGLVLLEYVADNKEVARGWWVGGHLLNTYVLLLVLTWTAYLAGGGPSFSFRSRLGLRLGFVLFWVAGLGMTGALTALGDTLFPATDLASGTAMTFSPESHLFVRLRVWHPIMALGTGVLLLATIWPTSLTVNTARASRLAGYLLALFFGQMALGLMNLWLLAPVWLQVIHLLMADLIWIVLILFSAESLAVTARRHPS
jgi:heme A synthase